MMTATLPALCTRAPAIGPIIPVAASAIAMKLSVRENVL